MFKKSSSKKSFRKKADEIADDEEVNIVKKEKKAKPALKFFSSTKDSGKPHIPTHFIDSNYSQEHINQLKDDQSK